MRPDIIFQGSWCPRCVGKIPAAERLAELQQIAIARGGELLSQHYKPKQRLQWKCAEVTLGGPHPEAYEISKAGAHTVQERLYWMRDAWLLKYQ